MSLYTFEDIVLATKELSAKIKESGRKFDSILAVSRGGMIPAGLLAYNLSIKTVYVIGIESYTDDNEQEQVTLIHSPGRIAEPFENVLVVDDIADTGATLELVKNLYTGVSTATLLKKERSSVEPDFYTKTVENETWVDFAWER